MFFVNFINVIQRNVKDEAAQCQCIGGSLMLGLNSLLCWFTRGAYVYLPWGDPGLPPVRSLSFGVNPGAHPGQPQALCM